AGTAGSAFRRTLRCVRLKPSSIVVARRRQPSGSDLLLLRRRGARGSRRRGRLRNLVERLDGVVDVGLVGLRGARFARPYGVDVIPFLAERDLLFLPAVVELHGDDEPRLIGAG